MTKTKPLPYVTSVDQPYWQGLTQQCLQLQHCEKCSRWQHPAVTQCPRCGCAELVWRPSSGHARVHTFTIMHKAYDESFAADVPYNVAVVELVEGPLVLTNIVGCTNDEIYIGMPVEAVFEERAAGVTIAKFGLRGAVRDTSLDESTPMEGERVQDV